MIKARAERTGDGTYQKALTSQKGKVDDNNNDSKLQDEKHADLWGWGEIMITLMAPDTLRPSNFLQVTKR